MSAAEVAVPFDDEESGALLERLAATKRELAAARAAHAEAEAAVRQALGQPDDGARVATRHGRAVARWSAFAEQRVDTAALKEGWPGIAEAVTVTRTRTRFTVETPEETV